MEFSDWIACAALVLSLIAIGVSIWQGIDTRKSRKAAEASAAANRELTDIEARRDAERAAAPPWLLIPRGRHSFRLNNTSTATMRDVRIEPDPNDPPYELRTPGLPCDIDSGTFRDFAFLTAENKGRTGLVIITWTHPDGDPRKWTAKLPFE